MFACFFWNWITKNLTHWSLRSFCPWTPGSYHFQGSWSPNKLGGLLKYCIKLPDCQNFYSFLEHQRCHMFCFFLLIFVKQKVSHVLFLGVTCLLIELAFFSFKRAYNTWTGNLTIQHLDTSFSSWFSSSHDHSSLYILYYFPFSDDIFFLWCNTSFIAQEVAFPVICLPEEDPTFLLEDPNRLDPPGFLFFPLSFFSPPFLLFPFFFPFFVLFCFLFPFLSLFWSFWVRFFPFSAFLELFFLLHLKTGANPH